MRWKACVSPKRAEDLVRIARRILRSCPELPDGELTIEPSPYVQPYGGRLVSTGFHWN